MTTALTLMTDAFLALGVADSSETLVAADSALALRVLNRMMDGWSQEGLMAYRFLEATKATVAGTASYVTSAFSPAWRPVAGIEYAYLRDSAGLDTELRPMTMEEYSFVPSKSTRARPERYAVDGEFPDSTVYLAQTPDAVYTFTIGYREAIDTFGVTSDVLAEPPGYELAIVTNLTLMLAPYYGVLPTALQQEQAMDAKAAIKRNNITRGKLRGDGSVPVRTGPTFNIFQG